LTVRKLAVFSIGVVLLAGSAAAVSQSATGDPLLPPGAGRDQVVAICTSCHGAWAFAQLREGRTGWNRVIGEMVMHGAQVTPEDIDPIANYLSTEFGPGKPVPTAIPADVTLPPGKAKDLVSGACGTCHGLDRVSAGRRSQQEWNRVVARMTSYGLPLAEDQSKTIAAYLAQHFGAQ
jgi:mono/diheme cytochrome c family protein